MDYKNDDSFLTDVGSSTVDWTISFSQLSCVKELLFFITISWRTCIVTNIYPTMWF